MKMSQGQSEVYVKEGQKIQCSNKKGQIDKQ